MLAGMAAGFGVSSVIHGVIEATHRIHELSKEFRVSTDTIQQWDAGAKRVGLAAEDSRHRPK